jgi:hypothetical protein
MFIGGTQGQTGRTPISIQAPIRGLCCTKRRADSPSFSPLLLLYMVMLPNLSPFEKQVFSERRGPLISIAKNQRVATSLATEFLERPHMQTGQDDRHGPEHYLPAFSRPAS